MDDDARVGQAAVVEKIIQPFRRRFDIASEQRPGDLLW
jgi:hypothetical protein